MVIDMRKAEMLVLTEKELYDLSMQKNRRGSATTEALKAQKIIWERAGNGFGGSQGLFLLEDGNYATKGGEWHWWIK